FRLLQIEISRNGAVVEELVLAVVERAVALKRALRLDPQLVVIGADPSLSFPTEVAVGAIPPAFELTKDDVGQDWPVHYRLHGLHAGGRVVLRGRGLRRSSGRKGEKRGGEGEDAGGAHATCTSRNMPISMW